VHRRAFEDEGEVVAGLVEALLRDDPAALSVVAEESGEVVGHVLITRSLLDAPPRLVEVGVLSPLGVRPDRQGQGIGTALVRRGLELADQRRVPVVFLEGSPRYYPRLGFRPGADLGFRKPSLRIPDAAFQAVTLSAYEPWMTGTLVYSSTFWDSDCVGLRDPGG
jgi:putative acetyltransferase